MIRVGIDQGKNGAICVYDKDAKAVQFFNMRGDTDERVEFSRILKILCDVCENQTRPVVVNIERLAVFAGKTGCNASFEMGRSQGVAEAALDTLLRICEDDGVALAVGWHTPSSWKRAMGLIGKNKQESKNTAYKRAYMLGVELPSRMRHDCAEAFLIALL